MVICGHAISRVTPSTRCTVGTGLLEVHEVGEVDRANVRADSICSCSNATLPPPARPASTQPVSETTSTGSRSCGERVDLESSLQP